MYEKPSNKQESEIIDFLTVLSPSLCANDASWGIAQDLNIIGMRAADAARVLRDNGHMELAFALRALSRTEEYIRFGGNVTVRSYKVFNPLTGVHESYETEAEAKAAYLTITTEVLRVHGPQITQEIVNQYEEALWVPYEITPTVTVS